MCIVDCYRDVEGGDNPNDQEEVEIVGDVDVGAAVHKLSGRFVHKWFVGLRSGHVVCGGVVEDPAYSQLVSGVFD